MGEQDQELQGGMELLDADHYDAVNPWGKPVVGWKPTTQGIGGLQNPMGWAFLRVVLWKMVEGAKVLLYDQPVIVENPGAIVICELDGKIGLVQNRRMVGPRLLQAAGSDYIKRLQRDRLWATLVKNMGEDRWEAPRGLIQVPPGELNVEEFVIKAAKLEALEEAGFKIKDARLAGRINVNPTFFLHPQWVVHAQIESVGEAHPENLEIIGAARLFTRQEMRELNTAGKLDDGLTLAGLALCGISI